MCTNDSRSGCDVGNYRSDSGRVIHLFEEGIIRVARCPGICVCKGWQEDLPEGLESVDDFGGLVTAVVDSVSSAIDSIWAT